MTMTTKTWRADRRPMLVFSNKPMDSHPLRHRGDYDQDPEGAVKAWVDETLARGYRRVMFLQPTGRAGDKPNDPVASFAAMPAKAQAGWLHGIQFAKNEGLEVSIYSGLYVSPGGSATIESAENIAEGGKLLRSPKYWDAAIQPWIDAGADWVMFDTLGDAYLSQPWAGGWLAGQASKVGRKPAWIGHEALSVERVGRDGHGREVFDLNQTHTPKGPALVMGTSMRSLFDPQRRMYSRAGWEVHVWLEDSGKGWDRAELRAWVPDLIARGFVVSGMCEGDAEVQAMIMAQGSGHAV